jgi:hypothetical protein
MHPGRLGERREHAILSAFRRENRELLGTTTGSEFRVYAVG